MQRNRLLLCVAGCCLLFGVRGATAQLPANKHFLPQETETPTRGTEIPSSEFGAPQPDLDAAERAAIRIKNHKTPALPMGKPKGPSTPPHNYNKGELLTIRLNERSTDRVQYRGLVEDFMVVHAVGAAGLATNLARPSVLLMNTDLPDEIRWTFGLLLMTAVLWGLVKRDGVTRYSKLWR